MIDLFFWLQDRESAQEKMVNAEDKNTELAIRHSSETKDQNLQFTRRCLECLNEGVLEKIFYDHQYPVRTSPLDKELQLIGRYDRKNEKA